MFKKPLKDIVFQDIHDLIHVHKQDEGYNLDYKGEPKNFDEFANKMIKIFTSFANTNGGYIILGIEEKDKKNKVFEIVGISKYIQNRNIVEWLNQTLNGNVEPKLYYPDPRVIEIPDNEKIILIYYIPESTKKPHFNNRESRYFIRQNDSSEAAKHYSIRDMFETTRRHYDEFNEFLAKRNLLDEESNDFALTPNSRKLATEIFTKDKEIPQPLFLLSFICKTPGEQIVSTHKQEFINWINMHSQGHQPIPNLSTFSMYVNEFNLHGLTTMSYGGLSYIEFNNNGYIERGLCDTLFWIWEPQNHNTHLLTLHITRCIGHVISMLHFAKKYYDYIDYDDEIVVQLNFKNVGDFIIDGMNNSKGRRDWRGCSFHLSPTK